VKILFDVRERTRNRTGIGTYARNLGRELGGLQMPGVECLCIPDRDQVAAGVDHLRRHCRNRAPGRVLKIHEKACMTPRL
jgi:hypothetical protein